MPRAADIDPFDPPRLSAHARARMDDHAVAPKAIAFILTHANLRRVGHGGCAIRRISERRLRDLARETCLPCSLAILSNLVVVTGRGGVVVTLYRDTNAATS